MAAIGAQPTTAQYVRTFFQDYIQQVFIGDYQELRTREHPLSKRQQILEAVEEIDTKQEKRSSLLDWYINRLCSGDQKKGHAAFQQIGKASCRERVCQYVKKLGDAII